MTYRVIDGVCVDEVSQQVTNPQRQDVTEQTRNQTTGGEGDKIKKIRNIRTNNQHPEYKITLQVQVIIQFAPEPLPILRLCTVTNYTTKFICNYPLSCLGFLQLQQCRTTVKIILKSTVYNNVII